MDNVHDCLRKRGITERQADMTGVNGGVSGGTVLGALCPRMNPERPLATVHVTPHFYDTSMLSFV